MNKSLSPQLLSPFDLRGLSLRNRVVMAPLTRARAGRENPRGVTIGTPGGFCFSGAAGAGVGAALAQVL